MSNIYYLGTFEDNKINKPFQFSTSWHNVLTELLEKSNIDIYEDFHFCATDDIHDPLFYQVTAENRHYLDCNEIIKEKYADIWQEKICLHTIKQFPLICDGIERDGVSYHIINEKVKEPQYDHIKFLEVDISYLKNEYPQHEEWFLRNILEYYNAIKQWVKDNQKIYYYRFY